ncbi:unnamed protein product [Brassica rapa subsp. trilocularis]
MLVDMLLIGFRVSIQSPQHGISLLALPPLLERDPTCIWEKVGLSLHDSANKKSILLESYYSDLRKGVMRRPQATQQIDHQCFVSCWETGWRPKTSFCRVTSSCSTRGSHRRCRAAEERS